MSTYYYPKNEVLSPRWVSPETRSLPWWVAVPVGVGALLAYLLWYLPWSAEWRRKDATIIVQVDFDGDKQWDARGSGVLISSNGYILTNRHLIYSTGGQRAKNMEIWFKPGRSQAVEKIIADYVSDGGEPADTSIEHIRNDWALLRAIRQGDFPFVELSEKTTFGLNEPVHVYGYSNAKDASVSPNGPSVSAPNGAIQRVDAPQDRALRIVHTAQPPDAGMTGGPLIHNGKLIGIHTMRAVGEVGGEGDGGGDPAGEETGETPKPQEQYALPVYLLRETVFSQYGGHRK